MVPMSSVNISTWRCAYEGRFVRLQPCSWNALVLDRHARQAAARPLCGCGAAAVQATHRDTHAGEEDIAHVAQAGAHQRQTLCPHAVAHKQGQGGGNARESVAAAPRQAGATPAARKRDAGVCGRALQGRSLIS